MSIEDNLTTNDLLTLVQIAGELTSRIDLKDLLQLILSKSGELTDSPDGAVLLYNAERKSLYFAGAIGEKAAFLLERYGEFAQQQVPVEKSKAGIVFSSGESIIDDYLTDDPNHYKGVDKETSQATESMLCVPLIAVGERLGVMQILNKRSGGYTERDKILLEQFANYAAVGLRNARLFEELVTRIGLYTSREHGGSITELLDQLKSPARSEKLTVLFADMRGFRSLVQIVNNPETILKFTSQFVTMLSEQVLNNGGIVNKFLGDGILALFRREDHAHRAVKCAFNMVEEFVSMRSLWEQESIAQIDFLDIGLGITTDHVIIGTIGNGKVHDFTAIGNAVNLAAAFEKDARGGRRILVDHPTYLAVKEIVTGTDAPRSYQLKQPDQVGGHFYPQYHLKELKSKSKVFISHTKLDRQFIEETLIPLLDKNNIGHWYSRNDIKGGESWVQSISTGLETSTYVLVVISKSSAEAGWVKEEVNMAAACSHLRDKIIPIRIDDTPSEAVNSFLRHKQAIDARNLDRYSSELVGLIK